MYSLTSALYGGEWSASCPSHFTPREIPNLVSYYEQGTDT